MPSVSLVEGFRFLAGDDLVIAIAGDLPRDANTFTLRATPDEIVFQADQREIGRFPTINITSYSEIFQKLTGKTAISVIRFKDGERFEGVAERDSMYVCTARPMPTGVA